VSSGFLLPGRTYQVAARFQQGQTVTTTFPETAYGFFSETRFTLKTLANSSGGDTTPPELVGSAPTNGMTGVFSGTPVVFSFSESMDTTRIGIQWSSGLDASAFLCEWGDDGKSLVCFYPAGFPAAHIGWALNSVAGAANNFHDLAGNELPAGKYHGTFAVAGATGGCDGAGVVEGAGFGLFKQANYLQSGPFDPTANPTNAASAYAFVSYALSIGTLPPITSIEFPAPPAPLPHKLDFLSATTFIGTGLSVQNQSFSSKAALDAAYPAEDYAFQVRNTAVQVIDQVVLHVQASGYPPIPRFANYAAAQAVDPTNDFTLEWTPVPGAGTNDALALQIADNTGTIVFSAPNTCLDIALPVTAASIVVPAGTLVVGQSYQATLSFFHVTDHQADSVTAEVGVAALGSVTRMPLVAMAGAAPASAAVFSLVRVSDPHTGLLQLTVSPSHDYVIQTALSPTGPWTPFSTNQSPVGSLNVPFDPSMLGAAQFFRALAK
jgi:hypothetical protein